jgi:mitochondrial splicing suppressor protein 51
VPFKKTNIEHSSTYSTPRLKGLEKHVPDPFTKLDQGKYLYTRSETDVFKLLIDSFRIRQADDFTYEGKIIPYSVYAGAPSSVQPFRQYLDNATARHNLLPPWWTAEKGKECAIFGESGAWSDLRKKVTKQEVIEQYGDDRMPMQLRMLAEIVYGTGTMGQDGSNTRKLMIQMESGGSGTGPHISMFNVSSY